MKFLNLGWLAAALALLGCGGPVPSGVYLTMSVSTFGVAVETLVNGKSNEFLSSENGWMSGGGPINTLVHEGENEASFILKAVETEEDQSVEYNFLATLEIAVKGEMVDTLAPGERVIFSRELNEEETAAIDAGETVTITERFTVEKAKLEAVKTGAR